MPIRISQYATSLTSHRLLLYGALSSAAVAAVLSNAIDKHNNFYSIAVYLSKSNGSVVILANFTVFLALLWGRLLQSIFFGPLRPMEVERLYDRMWFFITESLLAFTIFRDEFDTPFALWFGAVLFTKCFHWLLSDRVEWMDQRPYPGPPLSFHVRTIALFIILWVVDIATFLFTIEYMLTFGIGGTVLFTSEYAILIASLVNSFAKYCISIIDLRRASRRGGENAPPWEDKSMLIFYVELTTDFMKLVTYLAFFMVVLAFYGLPLNVVRDVYVTARSFIMRLRDLIRYRTATRNMDERYPNATEAELTDMSDKTCIICRDEMTIHSNNQDAANEQEQTEGNVRVAREGPNTTPKKLPCGHIFHFYCLRAWLERQQSCPTCRRSVLESNQPARANGQIPPPLPRRGLPGERDAGNEPAQVQIPIANGHAGNAQVLHGQQMQYPVYRLPNQPLHPAAQPAPLHGFWGPDGVWHPWPRYPEAPAQADLGQDISASGINTNQAPVQASENAATSAESSANSDPASNQSRQTPSSAREAAAAAALRRLNPSASSSDSRALDSRAPTPTTNTPRDAQSTSANQNGSPLQNGNTTARAPVLIPLFDLDTREQAFYGAGRMNGIPNGRPPAPQSGIDIQSLPQQLTAEQMGRLDRLTRDALDERLRILENVQTTTERCIEELLKCRSMFPRDPREPLPPDYYPSGLVEPRREANGEEAAPNERQTDGEQPVNQAG